MLVALVVVVVNFRNLSIHLTGAAAGMQAGTGLLILVGVLSITKVIRITHAIACIRFGGECREIGRCFSSACRASIAMFLTPGCCRGVGSGF